MNVKTWQRNYMKIGNVTDAIAKETDTAPKNEVSH